MPASIPTLEDPETGRQRMQRHLVHIGYHKTATTWFQAEVYPRVANARFLDPRTVRATFLADSALKFDPGAARQSLGLTDTPAVICEESLSGDIQNGGLWGCLSKDLGDRLHRTLGEADVVIVLRHQVDMIAACYKQYLRNGGTHRPHRYMFPGDYRKGAYRRPQRLPLFSLDHFEYAPLIAWYQQLFGAERVHVFLYEDVKADPPGFLRDFATRFGLDLDPAAVSPAPRHPSYGRGTVPLARLVNRFCDRSVVDKTCWLNLLGNRHRKAMLERLNHLPALGAPINNDALLGPDLIACIRRHYAASNTRLAQDLDLPLARHGYPLTEV